MADHKKSVKVIKSRYLQPSQHENERIHTPKITESESKLSSLDESIKEARRLRNKYEYLVNTKLLISKNQEHKRDLEGLFDQLLEKVQLQDDHDRLNMEKQMLHQKIELLQTRLSILEPYRDNVERFRQDYQKTLEDLTRQQDFLVLRDVSLPEPSVLLSKLDECQNIASRISLRLPSLTDLETSRKNIELTDAVNERNNLEKETRLSLLRVKYDNYIEQLHKKFFQE